MSVSCGIINADGCFVASGINANNFLTWDESRLGVSIGILVNDCKSVPKLIAIEADTL